MLLNLENCGEQDQECSQEWWVYTDPVLPIFIKLSPLSFNDILYEYFLCILLGISEIEILKEILILFYIF